MYYDSDHADNTTYISHASNQQNFLNVAGTSGTGNPAIARLTFSSVNCTGITKANGVLQIDLKCSAPSSMSSNGQLELSSSLSDDTNEWGLADLTGLGITTDYKTFYLPMADWTTVGGEVDVSDVKRIRWYNHSTNGDITIYWRRAILHLGNPEARHNVWDTSYQLVSHMTDLTTDRVPNSTVKCSVGLKSSANNPVEADCDIGKCQDFSSDILNYGQDESLNITGNITVESTWTIDTLPGAGKYPSFIGKTANFTGYALTFQTTNNLHFVTGHSGADWDYSPASGLLAIETWYHAVGVYDGSRLKLYINGAEISAPGTAFSSGLPTNSVDLKSGGHYSDPGTYGYMDGKSGSDRVSNTDRSAAWIKATYNSLFNTLLTYGSEESSGWTGKINGVTNPSKICGVLTSDIGEV